MALLNCIFTPKLGLAAIMIHFVLIAGCAQYPAPANNRADVNSAKAGPSPQNPDDQRSPEVLVTSLSSSDDAVRTAAKDELLKIAQSSSAGRDTVIKELISAVRRTPELDGSRAELSGPTLTFWRSFTSLMSKLKATEAIDAMVTCIHCSNGFSGHMGEPPAIWALVQIGDPAVPKLSDALLHDSNGYKRIQVIICLDQIGGPKSKAALKKALAAEKDKSMRSYIRRAL